MKIFRSPAAGTAVFLVVLGNVVAHAAEVRVLSAVGMRQVMLDLAPQFERATGHTVTITFDAFGLIMKRIEGAETSDVVIIPQAGIERLGKDGKIVAGTGAELASSIASVAVRKGAPKPDISSPEAFRKALVDAKSVARPDPAAGGSSGLHIVKVLERLGIVDHVNAKTVLASRPGDTRAMPGYAVADGHADIALHQLQELLAVPGIDIVGPFPADLQERFVFSGAVMTGARDLAAARALIAFLRTPEARAAIGAKGMEAGKP